MKEPVLTKKDVANRLGVSTRTVQRLGLPHTKVGGQNRYVWSQVATTLGIEAEKPPLEPPRADVGLALDGLDSRLVLIQQELAAFRSELDELRKQLNKEGHG